jgi:ABC-type branched-subunit amino acid transport system substrate-binding protein
MQRRGFLGGLAAAWGAAAAAARDPGALLSGASAPGALVLGQSAALTGPAAALGQQFKQGAELFFQRWNAAGGLNGRPIALRSLDDGLDTQRCIANTRQLLDEGVLALFGYVGSATSRAALPLATAAQRVFFAPFTGSEALRIPFNPLAFHLRASYVDETRAIVRHLTSVGIQRIGVFCQNDADGKAGLLGVARALKRQYQAPAGVAFAEPNAEAVDAAVRTVLAGRPDAIVQISTYRGSAAFIRAARRAGFTGSFYNTSFANAQALARELGPAAQGVVVSQVMPFPFAPKTRLAGEYLAAGRELWGDRFEPGYGSIEGYVAAKTFAEGLRRARGADTPALVAGLQSLRELDLGDFRIDLAPGHHAGSRFIDLTMLTAEGKVRY